MLCQTQISRVQIINLCNFWPRNWDIAIFSYFTYIQYQSIFSGTWSESKSLYWIQSANDVLWFLFFSPSYCFIELHCNSSCLIQCLYWSGNSRENIVFWNSLKYLAYQKQINNISKWLSSNSYVSSVIIQAHLSFCERQL